MNATGYAFLGLTAIVAALVAVLAFAVLRFFAAARDTRRLRAGRSESALLAATLEDAITKLKAQERAMAARAEASDRLRSEIVASLTSGLVVVDSEGDVQILNPAARRILRIGDALDVPVSTVLNDVGALRSVVEESRRTGKPIVRRTVIVERAEGPMHLGVTVSPLTADSGTGGAICLFSDLTSVIALEEQLRLKEALARLGELTAGLAHEFRNGLATIHGYARLMDPSALPPLQRPYIEGIREETDSLGQIVTNFLNFAKPDPLMLAPVDLRSLIARAAEDVPSARVGASGEFGAVDGDEV
ncbi:MAG: histidine kinase dimerization/phospho-acceptor domain-containing protein, partial [Vicinamibacterales bacterium]